MSTAFQRKNYTAQDLVSSDVTGQKWGVALLEIHDSPRHFHRIEKELFVVVQGKLDIEIDGTHQILKAGESIEIAPGRVHHLKSAATDPVKVLCVSFPAFDPKDMYCVD